VLSLLNSQLLIQLSQTSLLILHLSGELLLLTLDHTESVMLVSQSLVLSVDFILEVGNVMRSDLEFTLEFNDFILGLNAVLGVQVTLSTDSFVQVLLLLHLGFVLHVLLLEFGDEVLLEFDLFNHLHQVSVGLVGVLTVGVSLLLNLGDQAHEFSASDGLQVQLLSQSGDEGLLLVQVILVLGVGLLNLAQVLLHHVTLTDQVVDVLLLLVGLLVNPLDFSGQSGHSVGSNHLLVQSLFATRFETVVLLVKVFQVTLRLTDDLFKLTDSVSAHLLFLNNFLVVVLESLERCLHQVELTVTVIQIVAVLAFVGHFLLLLLIKSGHLELQTLDFFLKVLLLLFVLLDHDFLVVDVFF
jgi:hypothetical protein